MFRISKAPLALAVSAIMAFGAIAAVTLPASAEVTTSKTVHVKPHSRFNARYFKFQRVHGYYKTVKIEKYSGSDTVDKNGHIVHVGGVTRKVTVIGRHKTTM